MTILENIQKLSAEQITNSAVDYCKKEGYSIAIWKQPDAEGIQLIIDFCRDILPSQNPLTENKKGFVLAPFSRTKDAYVLQADLHLSLQDYQLIGGAGLEISDKTDHFINYLEEKASTHRGRSQKIEISTNQQEEEQFKNLVKRSIASIQSGLLQKVVPSRKKEILLPENFNIGKNFLALADTYRTAFASLVYTPKTGVWMGVSPELLILEKDNIFKTVALAGTQDFEPGVNISNVAWTQKEIEEQALVSRYIINCFKQIRLREYVETGPKTVIAGNLLHLKTDYKVDMVATGFPNLGETMLGLLHPTSAVCGMPLESSLAFIEKYENYDREYFSGYLGPVCFEGATSLFVNLRCMHIEDRKGTLFAGAGVTEDSLPDKEWEETEIKFKTILNIIH